MWESTCLLPCSISPLGALKCLSFSLIRWPQQGKPHQQPQPGGLGLGLWRVYDFILHIDSKWICIRMHMSGVVGIRFATKALCGSCMNLFYVGLKAKQILCFMKNQCVQFYMHPPEMKSNSDHFIHDENKHVLNNNTRYRSQNYNIPLQILLFTEMEIPCQS